MCDFSAPTAAACEGKVCLTAQTPIAKFFSLKQRIAKAEGLPCELRLCDTDRNVTCGSGGGLGVHGSLARCRRFARSSRVARVHRVARGVAMRGVFPRNLFPLLASR